MLQLAKRKCRERKENLIFSLEKSVEWKYKLNLTCRFQDDVTIFVSQKNLYTDAQNQEIRFGDIDHHTFISFLVIQDFGHYGYS